MDSGEIIISVIIKTFNEETYIAKTIESVINEVSAFSYEILVADCLSLDNTALKAKKYPVKFVSLTNPLHRSCGIAPQLGYQHAVGKYIYLIDGDMELIPGFLQKAIDLLDSDNVLAGASGILIELGGTNNYEFEMRKNSPSPFWSPGEQNFLVGGGLYKREAIESVGYFSNRNLHANEEKELGLRLVQHGWRLIRLDTPAIQHHGHSMSSASMIFYRWKNRYVDGPGELLRASIGQDYFKDVLISQKKPIAILAMWSAIMVGILAIPFHIAPIIGISCLTLLFMASFILKKRSLKYGLIGIINLQINTAGYLRGLLTKQINPMEKISSTIEFGDGLELHIKE